MHFRLLRLFPPRIASALVCTLVLAGPACPQDATASRHERWIVHFHGEGVDLTPLRRAIRDQAAPANAAAIVADLERAMRERQKPGVAALRRLGARVVAQWWIVNACAVEIAAGQAEALRALPQVLRLERDTPHQAAGDDANDKHNHNVDAVRLAGFDGAGAVLAVLDSGFDVSMGGSGRPHRVFFRNGDPANTSGPGIGGSRLLFAKQMGAILGGVANHGTAVSSVAAGGGWGTPASAPGVASAADIAGYALADYDGGATNGATKVSAWQQVLVDRLSLPIQVANLSYHGDPDPLSAQNQAMDQAALSGDLLIACAAGNQGPGGTGGSESNANGLAIAAVRADFHDLLGYSTRGPIVGDPQRSYPDLAACIHSFTPWPDCETVDETFNGTSNASPQVAGVATVLRKAVPTLTAVETKAVLLASALDISASNPAHDRNGYGMGLLRADTALATAQDPKGVRSATLTTAVPTWSYPLDVTRGEPYAVAIAWHRKVMSSTAWSDLNLRILDGATVVASSATPRNLYEMVRFTAPRTATLQAEVTGAFLEQGNQSFALVFARAARAMPAGTFSGFGDSCAGSSGATHVPCAGVNVLATAADVVTEEVGGNYEVALILDPPKGVGITGFEMLLGCGSAVVTHCSLYEMDSHKTPTGAAVRTASILLAPAAAWQRWVFAQPYVSSNGHPIAVSVRSSTTTHFTPVLRFAGGTLFFRDICGGGWNGPFPTAIGVRLLRAGAGKGLAPILVNDGVPQVGGAFALRLTRAAANGAATLLLGTSRDSRGGVALPIDLTASGAPGCALLVSDDGPPWNPSRAAIPVSTDGAGGAAVPLALPGSPSLAGMTFYCQFLALDPAANALGVTTTRGTAARIGVP
jgi:subtilisin family serine protease